MICLLAGLLASIRCLALVSGCSYRELRCTDPNLSLLRCDRCGHVALHWRWSEP